MSLGEIIGPVQRWDAAGRSTCIALLFRVEGSSPRPPGSRLAVNDQGEMAGYISLGCVEGDVREHVRQVLGGAPASVVHYGVADETALGVGLSCGGRIDVLLTRHEPADPAWRALCAASARGHAVLVTRIQPADGRQMLLDSAGTQWGGLGMASLDQQAAQAARDLEGERRAILRPLGEDLCLFEPISPPARLILVGASPVAASLCKLASAIGMDVTVVDPRRDFANPQLFPGARRIVLEWPEKGLAEAGAGPEDGVAILSHDAKFDLPGLESALRAGCRYVGLLGGRKTQEQRRKALAERGFSADDLARLRGPIGLRIGSVTPDEIAVSILAEIISLSPSAIRKKEEHHE
ncbi:MAG TPA: XdhC family protein [Kiritimatiellia bacterium]|nr:XdhC family protein [Kiritimatiellia bacterium]HRZ12027.1 XdhC family protein [Kiritimatiellia bacterium]HSA17167.1 XdhC family protein [Kiritimatiellia bacterium]